MITNISDKRKERRKHNSNLEVSGTQEFFTPKFLCDEMLDKISKEDWKDITKTFLDSTCGNGNFLVNIYERKLKWCNSVNDSLIALNSIYGTELMEDNTEELKERLYKLLISYNFNITDEIKNIVNNNIVCTDFFKWDYENWCPIKENKCDALF